ncbi:MAG TPA: hypothetical protein PLM81_07850 [Ginsengibacter sp.]|nr:hypothetical protein [Chitinophagaceae bacterium]HRN73025.1 hypothetical protein [Ginsengibacter sp.]HRP16878.1 hypothetical protein [Ginsengibacter sp.]HRP44306.1 hypothetical protein [Ginsengibacter sp.]
MYPDPEKKKPAPKKESGTRNLFYIILASVAVGALLYFTVKEGERIKKENELLDYEVW